MKGQLNHLWGVAAVPFHLLNDMINIPVITGDIAAVLGLSKGRSDDKGRVGKGRLKPLVDENGICKFHKKLTLIQFFFSPFQAAPPLKKIRLKFFILFRVQGVTSHHVGCSNGRPQECSQAQEQVLARPGRFPRGQDGL